MLSTQIIPGDGVSIATLGSDDTFVVLRYRSLGAVIELTTEMTIYFPVTGAYDSEEIGRQICDDEDDAINAAVDLQRAARKRLAELDVIDVYSDPDDYAEALELHFERAAAVAMAAE